MGGDERTSVTNDVLQQMQQSPAALAGPPSRRPPPPPFLLAKWLQALMLLQPGTQNLDGNSCVVRVGPEASLMNRRLRRLHLLSSLVWRFCCNCCCSWRRRQRPSSRMTTSPLEKPGQSITNSGATRWNAPLPLMHLTPSLLHRLHARRHRRCSSDDIYDLIALLHLAGSAVKSIVVAVK